MPGAQALCDWSEIIVRAAVYDARMTLSQVAGGAAARKPGALILPAFVNLLLVTRPSWEAVPPVPTRKRWSRWDRLYHEQAGGGRAVSAFALPTYLWNDPLADEYFALDPIEVMLLDMELCTLTDAFVGSAASAVASIVDARRRYHGRPSLLVTIDSPYIELASVYKK